jgi:hypothetical protein
VGNERLDEELVQGAPDGFDGQFLAGAGLNPGAGLGPGLVEGEQAALPTALDQLIGFGDHAGTRGHQPRVGGFGLVQDAGDTGAVGEGDGGKPGRGIMRGRRR